jgi:uncharacterized protein DUF2188
MFLGAYMTEMEYFIVPEGATWKVTLHNQDSISYETLEEAIEAAIELARGARTFGFSTEVFVPRAEGGWASVRA